MGNIQISSLVIQKFLSIPGTNANNWVTDVRSVDLSTDKNKYSKFEATNFT